MAKENPYDDPRFFDQYRQMPRSTGGLANAGEWHELQAMLPDLHDKTVLDLGCGFGWHCRYAVEQGASAVVGVDLSEKMLAVAAASNSSPHILYQRAAIEDISFDPESFDLILSSLALHYVDDFHGVCRRLYPLLRPAGELVFSVEHPIFTAQGPQQWTLDETGRHEHWPVDHYFSRGRRESVFLGETVVKYHRTLADYFSALLESGFEIRRIGEPTPPAAMLAEFPEANDELRRPMMLLIAARKPS